MIQGEVEEEAIDVKMEEAVGSDVAEAEEEGTEEEPEGSDITTPVIIPEKKISKLLFSQTFQQLRYK